ncbi:MAG: RluA family pseudouridine synthase, partial [Verrucomicrobiota bacterium]
QHILNAVYHPQKPHPAHRLDANTTGIVLVTRTRHFASKLQPQFERGEVKKVYLVRVNGLPAEDEFFCNAPISEEPGTLGSRRIDFERGLPSRTEFQVKRRDADGTSLLEARPLTGRTNQIRVHLWHLGFPVLGDETYLSDRAFGETQTLDTQSPPLCLHAWRISFVHPLTKQFVEFSAPLPGWAET